jgi:hypothetical protein
VRFREPSVAFYAVVLLVLVGVLTAGGYLIRSSLDGWRYDLFINISSVLIGGTLALMSLRYNRDRDRTRGTHH